MELTFENTEFELWSDKSVLCEIDFLMTEAGEHATMPSLNDPGDPGCPPVFEITEIRLTEVPENETLNDKHLVLSLSETHFIAFFENGQDTVNNAYEWVHEQEPDFRDDEPWD